MPARVAELTRGPYGDRAGDVILVANNGNRERADQRYYFAPPYHSWHGSPSHRDSDIPLIVAHPKRSRAQIRRTVAGVLEGQASQRLIGELIVRLRLGDAVELSR